MAKSDYIILIHKYLTGEISAEDKESLDQWLTSSPSNQQLLEEFRGIWELADKGEETIELTDEEFQEEMKKLDSAVQESIRKDKLIAKYQRTNRIRLSILVAVVIAAGALAAIPHLHLQKATPTIVNASTHELTTVMLPDSTQAHLNQNTSITYAETKKGRAVQLSGKAMFQVSTKTKPFIVSAGGAQININGGASCIIHANMMNVEVNALSTGVNVQLSKKVIALTTHEQLIIHNPDSITKRPNSDLNSASWYTRLLVFKNTELEMVLKSVEDVYPVTFHITKPKLLQCRFTGKFNHASLEEILETLAFSLDITFSSNNGSSYQISGHGCLP